MFITIKEESQEITPDQREKMYWDQLMFDSHRWVEYHKGYYKCEFCEASHTSSMPTNRGPMCKKNPYLKF
jgi:hypothetical protein